MNSLKAEFYTEVESFKGLNQGFRTALHDMSPDDKRREWKKLEDEFKSLKGLKRQIASLDHTADLTAVNESYTADVEKDFLESQRLVLFELKDIPSTSGGEIKKDVFTTKIEAVRLPSFTGDERTSPYLKFAIWKKQWDVLISEYDEKWRSGLWDHLDDEAKSKYVGWETDYDEAIKRLERFYADPIKFISCVMKEVLSFPFINYGEYRHLVSYSLILENNFNRLVCLGLQHEISNTSTMTSILKKFPRSVEEKWNEYLSTLDNATKIKPFSAFIKWLETQREVWERMTATEVGRKKMDSFKMAGTYYGDNVYDRADKRVCFSCGEEGHIRRFCPKNGEKFGGNGDVGDSRKKVRKKPVHKNFWCAYHKDDDDRNCWSGSCQELKKLADTNKRIQLLKENRDCLHCCGDHTADICPRKDRKCGGDKPESGCSKDHNLH